MASFEVTQGAQLVAAMRTRHAKALRQASLLAAMRTVNHITQVLIPGEKLPPVSTGAYRAGWRVEPGNPVRVVNTIPYASHIDRGVRAANVKIGRRMIDALAEWVRLKGLTPRRGVNAAQEARNVAWAIAKNMQRVGIFNRDGRQGLSISDRARAMIPTFMREELKAALKGAR